jgi:hypothetical protein
MQGVVFSENDNNGTVTSSPSRFDVINCFTLVSKSPPAQGTSKPSFQIRHCSPTVNEISDYIEVVFFRWFKPFAVVENKPVILW